MNKVLIAYIRKPKLVYEPVAACGFCARDETLYRKTYQHVPCGVLVATKVNDELYFGWSYISKMSREENISVFSKKVALKIALDKVRTVRDGKPYVWYVEDMPYVIRKRINVFIARAKKYFKINEIANLSLEDRIIGFRVVE